MITYLNNAWIKFTGQSWKQSHGIGAEGAVHPDDRELATQTYRDAFQEQRPFAVEYRLRRADGEYRWFREHGAPDFGPNGELLGFTGSAIAIEKPNNIIIRRATVTA